MLNSSVGTYENFETFTVAVPVSVLNTGSLELIFRSGNFGFSLPSGESKVLPPAAHIYKVYVTTSATQQEEVNICIASIAYSSPVLFMVHEGQAVDGASFVSSVPISPLPQN